MSSIWHKIEHEATHIAKETGKAIEGAAESEIAKTVVDSVTTAFESGEAEEVLEVTAEVVA